MGEKIGPQPEQFATDGLTPEEDLELALLLSKWGGGRISTPVFTYLARMTPQAIVEVVLFRVSNETLETLLIPRPKDDIVWPGMFHTPGTALRASDFQREDGIPLNGAFERVKREINNEFASPPTFVVHLHRLSERGPDVTEVYIAELLEGSPLQPGQLWYPVGQLLSNPNFIQAQHGHVMIAAEAYTKRIIPN